MSTKPFYSKKSPCKNCPYRKDAPKRLWSVAEFIDLKKNEKSELGTTYGCHKADGCVCVGWLMNQDKNNLPSIMLRISLSKNNITRDYLDSLTCKSEQYKTVDEMCIENYPENFKK